VDILLGLLNVIIVILTVFLVGIILIQRGKGGGLAGAFGGMGGSSAFGTRTGDVFTKITVGVAIAWILLSMLMVVLTNRRHSSAFVDSPAVATKESDSKTARSSSKSKANDRGDASVPGPLPSSAETDLPAVLPELPNNPAPVGKSAPPEKPAPVEKSAPAGESKPVPKTK
jgi:preprotein translocase subunit SecG